MDNKKKKKFKMCLNYDVTVYFDSLIMLADDLESKF